MNISGKQPATQHAHITFEEVASKARFVTDIGARLAKLWTEYEFMRDTIEEARATGGGICMEIAGTETRVRIGQEIWQDDGIDLEEAVQFIVGRFDTA